MNICGGLKDNARDYSRFLPSLCRYENKNESFARSVGFRPKMHREGTEGLKTARGWKNFIAFRIFGN